MVAADGAEEATGSLRGVSRPAFGAPLLPRGRRICVSTKDTGLLFRAGPTLGATRKGSSAAPFWSDVTLDTWPLTGALDACPDARALLSSRDGSVRARTEPCRGPVVMLGCGQGIAMRALVGTEGPPR